MSDLAAWLLERIAEDEAAAQTAAGIPTSDPVGPHWSADDGMIYAGTGEHDGPDDNLWADEGSRYLRMASEHAVHVARWDPARVLAECEAKRRIVEWESDPKVVSGPPEERQVLRLLALPYADRPGYDEAWRP